MYLLVENVFPIFVKLQLFYSLEFIIVKIQKPITILKLYTLNPVYENDNKYFEITGQIGEAIHECLV